MDTHNKHHFLQIFASFAIFQCCWITIKAGDDHIQNSANDLFENMELRDYDIVHPTRLDINGKFMTNDLRFISEAPAINVKKSSRRRRHIHSELRQDTPRLLYSVLHGNDVITLNLTANNKLIPDNFVIERIRTLNSTSEAFSSLLNHGTSWHCHFQGHVEGQPNSRVALSTCHGLTGLLLTEAGDYFIEPLKDIRNAERRESQPHKIYRRDLSSSIDRAEPMLHHEKLFNDNKLERMLHTKNEIAKKTIEQDLLDNIKPASSIFEDESEKEFCGVLDTKQKYRRIVRKREQWESRRSDSGIHNRGESTRGSRRRTRRSVSVERRIEMLVVVDQKMVEYYKKSGHGGVERYVLTIMNMVSELFRDASIGNSLHVSLVRLILLEDEKKGPKITTHAENTLDSFCKWAKKINPKSDNHPNHHDVAVLLTRQEICSQSNKSCETLGLAHVAGMCQSHRSCNVNQDTGLSVAYTVTHELGHNFAMHHDGQLNDCKPSPKYNHVMASHLISSSSPMRWSSCSRKYITRFLDRNWGFCLNDEPADHPDFSAPTNLPGVIYDADHQCRLMFGEKSSFCYGIDDVCHRLWCYVGGTCRSRLHAAAPGTKCGKGKWCMGGKCVSGGKRPKPVDGGWSDWSNWSSCSRTCGIGVSSATRHCENPVPLNGGQYCIGERKRYKTCNKWRCRASKDALTFREQQCAAFNNIKYKNYTFTWKPVDSALYPCELHCYTRHGKIPFADRLKDKVVDGTKCFPGSDDICVDGICRRVGCDKNIGSRASEDRCGVCHGTGSTCYEVKKLFDRRKGEEYTPIGLLPLGARNIEISEVTAVSNFLALRHATNKTNYYLNGNYMIQWDTKFQLAGTQFTYRRENETTDMISAPGPLDEEIMIVVLYVEENPGISIKYSVPYHINTNASEENYPEFKWKMMDWTKCTRECGKGHQVLTVVCVEKTVGIVKEYFCNKTEKPQERERTCNEKPCPARWWSESWDSCSVTCGSGVGVQRRLVMCVRSVGEGGQVALEHTDCYDSVRPTNKQRCRLETEIPCPVWREGNWKLCSKSCGGGVTNRTVECVTYVMNDVIDLTEIDDIDETDIQEIDIMDIDIPHKPRKNSKRQKGRVKKHENLLRGTGLIMSVEMDPLRHDYDVDLDGYDVEDDHFCDGPSKPELHKPCNTKQCLTTPGPKVDTTRTISEIPTSDYVETTWYDQTTDSEVMLALSNDITVDFQATLSTTVTPQTGKMPVPAGMLTRSQNRTSDDIEIPKQTQNNKKKFPTTHITTKSIITDNTSDKRKLSHKTTRQPSRSTNLIIDQKTTVKDSEVASEITTDITQTIPFIEDIDIDMILYTEPDTTIELEVTTPKPLIIITSTMTATTQSHISMETSTTRNSQSNSITTFTKTKPKSSVDDLKDVISNNNFRYKKVESKTVSSNRNDNLKKDPDFDVGVENTDTKGESRKHDVTKNRKDDEPTKKHVPVIVPDMRNVDLDFDVETFTDKSTHKKHPRTTLKSPTSTPSIKSTTVTSPPPTESEPITTTKKPEPTTPTGFLGKWITGDWSECSTTCGIGAKIRTVDCSLSEEKYCNQTDRPPPAIICNLRPCAKWVYGQWTKCSTQCGIGTRTKKVDCLDQFTQKILRPHHCRNLPSLTIVKISCHQGKCRPWKTSRWTSCSRVCGPGTQLRRVACSRYDHCNTALKPHEKKSCFVKKCVEWRPLEWNKCSVHCGGGIQRRDIICIEKTTGKRTNSSDCIRGLRPELVRKCNQGQCPVTEYDFSSCHSDRLTKSFCDILKRIGKCVQPSLAIQCCVTCQTYLSVRHKDKIS